VTQKDVNNSDFDIARSDSMTKEPVPFRSEIKVPNSEKSVVRLPETLSSGSVNKVPTVELEIVKKPSDSRSVNVGPVSQKPFLVLSHYSYNCKSPTDEKGKHVPPQLNQLTEQNNQQFPSTPSIGELGKRFSRINIESMGAPLKFTERDRERDLMFRKIRKINPAFTNIEVHNPEVSTIKDTQMRPKVLSNVDYPSSFTNQSKHQVDNGLNQINEKKVIPSYESHQKRP
jgi:hypothetical protein